MSIYSFLPKRVLKQNNREQSWNEEYLIIETCKIKEDLYRFHF